MESQRRSEQTKACLVRAKSKGKRLGRPLGAKYEKKRKRKGKEGIIGQ
jgi:DNA invertase Pin-like site-specific DNA recombinase